MGNLSETVAVGVLTSTISGAAGGATYGAVSSGLQGKPVTDMLADTFTGAINGAIGGSIGGAASPLIGHVTGSISNPIAQRVVGTIADIGVDTGIDILQGNPITADSVMFNAGSGAVGNVVLGQRNRGKQGNTNQNVVEKALSNPTWYDRKILENLKRVENFAEHAIEHIFEGNINRRGKAGGYHYNMISDSAGNLIPNSKKPANELGVYEGRVEVNGVVKTANGGYSTMFPDHMSPQEIVDAINEAYGNKKLYKGNTYEGTTKSGIIIQMFLDKNGKIISAYPLLP